MLLQLALVRQQAIQHAIQPRVVDLAGFDAQQIVQRRGRKPALLDCQLAAWSTQPIDRQQRSHARPGHLGLVPGTIQDRLEENDPIPAAATTQDLKTLAKAARALQPHTTNQHPRHLWLAKMAVCY
jgi:hypothetical protein